MGGMTAIMLQRERTEYFLFYKPFDGAIWVGICAACIIYSIVLYLSSIVNGKIAMRSNRVRESFSFSECLIYFSMVPLQLGTDRHPSCIAGKILQHFWSYFALLFLATFTANLAVFFLEMSFDQPLTNVEDILQSGYNAFTYSMSIVQWGFEAVGK